MRSRQPTVSGKVGNIIMNDVITKIESFRNKSISSGEKPPYVLTLDSDSIMWLMNPNGSKLTNIFISSEDEMDRIMSKVPCIVGKYKNVYIIQSQIEQIVLTPKSETDILEFGYQAHKWGLSIDSTYEAYEFFKKRQI
jgi:hypothetical protein